MAQKHIARIADNAVLTLSDDGDPTNNTVNVTSTLETAHEARARSTPDADISVGVGPSVAINATVHDAIAEIGNAQIENATDVNVTANGTHRPVTHATAGSAGRGPFPGAIALTGQSNDSIARLNVAESQTHLLGDLNVTADHDAQATTVADASAIGDGTVLGTAVAAGGPLGGGHAVAGPNMLVEGDVNIVSNTIARTSTDAESFSRGPVLGLRRIDGETKSQLRRLAEITGADEFLFPSFDPYPPMEALMDASAGVDPTTDTIRIEGPHSFDTGDAVVYRNNSDDTSIGGLNDEQSYYISIDPDDDNLVRLHNSLEDAISGANPRPLAKVAAPEDRHSLTAELVFDPNTAVDTDTDRINIGDFSGLQDGDPIRYFSNGVGVSGIVNGSRLFVNVDGGDADNLFIHLYRTRDDAIRSKNRMALNTLGTEHRIVRVQDGFASQRFAFNPATQVNSEQNTIEPKSAGGLISGDAVIYRRRGGDPVGALSDGQRVYVHVVHPDQGGSSPIQISLHHSRAAGISGAGKIELQALESADWHHELIPAVEFDPATAVEDGTDSIKLPTKPELDDGWAVRYKSGGNVIGGLVDDAVYYIVTVPDDATPEKVWLFDHKSQADSVIKAKRKYENSKDQLAIVSQAAARSRQLLDPTIATGTDHVFEVVDTLTKPDETWMPKRQFGSAAALAVGVSLPESVAAVGENGVIDVSGHLRVESLIDFDSGSDARVTSTEGIGLAVGGNYSEINQMAEIGKGAHVDAQSITIRAGGMDDQPLRYVAQAKGGARGAVTNGAGSLAVNAVKNRVSAQIGQDAHVNSDTSIDIFANVRAEEASGDPIDAGGVSADANAGNAFIGSIFAAVGAAGAGFVSLPGDTVESLIRHDAEVTADDDIRLRAEANQHSKNTGNKEPFSVPLAPSFTGSFGVAYSRTETDITSGIAGDVTSTAGSIVLHANASGSRDSQALGLGTSLDTAAGGAAVANISRNRGAAVISAGAQVNSAGHISLLAFDESTIDANSKGIAGAPHRGAGAGASLNISANHALASIGEERVIVRQLEEGEEPIVPGPAEVTASGDVNLVTEIQPTITGRATAISIGTILAAGGGLAITETDNLAESNIQKLASIDASTIEVQSSTVVNPETKLFGAQVGLNGAASMMIAQAALEDSAISTVDGEVVTEELDVLANSTREADTRVVTTGIALLQGEIGFEGELTGGITEARIGPNADISVSGDEPVNVHALSNDDAMVHMADAEIDVISIAAMASHAETASETAAGIDGKIDARTISVIAEADMTADAQTSTVGLSILGINGAILPKIEGAFKKPLPIPIQPSFDTESVAIIDSQANAFVGTGADILAAEELTLIASSTNTADSHLAGGGLNIIEGNTVSSEAAVHGATMLTIDEGAQIVAGSMVTRAEAENNAETRSTFGGIEGVTVDIADLRAATQHDVIARIGPAELHDTNGELSGTIHVAEGGIQLDAFSDNTADVKQVDVAITPVSIEIVRPLSVAAGTTKAHVGGNYKLDSEVNVSAESQNDVTTRAVNVEIDPIDVNVQRESAITRHTTEAFVTPHASLNVGGALNLDANSHNTANLDQIDAFNIAALEVSYLNATIDASGSTNAYVDRGARRRRPKPDVKCDSHQQCARRFVQL